MRPIAACILLLLVAAAAPAWAGRPQLTDDQAGSEDKEVFEDSVDDSYDLIAKLRQEEEKAAGLDLGAAGAAADEDEADADAADGEAADAEAAAAAQDAADDAIEDADEAAGDDANVLELESDTSELTSKQQLPQPQAAQQAGGNGGAASDKNKAAAAASDAADPKPKATPAPLEKFKIYNEQWLEQAEGMAEDFVATPAMERLKSGKFGGVDLKELGLDGAAQVATGTHAVLSRCLHTLNLFKAINLFHDGLIPKKDPPNEACAHRKFRLLFVMEKGANYWKNREILSELASVNIRLFAFASALADRGHTVQVADPEHLHQVDMEELDAIIFVKVLEQGFQMLQNSSVPLIWDHVDEWDGFPFWDVGTWQHKEVFAGVLTAGRVAKVAFDKAGVPAQILYHNHANYANFHRADRSPPVKVLALQGDYHNKNSDVFPMLEAYCEKHRLEFRSGHYTGKGWDVDEYAQQLKLAIPNHGSQLGWYMGFKSVDVAVLWPKTYQQFHICYKPTSRLAQLASLGIPLVTYPFVSYLDVLVEYGYPLVAETLEEAEVMLDKLRQSPELRQEASRVLLEMAKSLSVEQLASDYEQALCNFLSPEALELRKQIVDDARRRFN